MRNVAENIEKYILYSATFFPPENRVVYKTMSKNVIKVTHENTIQHMRLVSQVTKATYTHTHTHTHTHTQKYVTHFF